MGRSESRATTTALKCVTSFKPCLHESITALLHLVESSDVPDDISHGYEVVLGEVQVQQEENDGGGDEGQKVDVYPHAESLSNGWSFS